MWKPHFKVELHANSFTVTGLLELIPVLGKEQCDRAERSELTPQIHPQNHFWSRNLIQEKLAMPPDLGKEPSE
jgi:hypothetical protein